MCRCTMRRRCHGREFDDHAEARDLAVALEARPDDRAVEKGRVVIHSWRQGGTAWSLLVAREKPTAGMRRRRPSRRVFWWEVGHVATSGLAGVPETSRGKVWRFLQNRPRTWFRQFSQNCPREDSRRTRGDIRGIASGRSKLLQVVTAVGWSSMYLFRFAPKGLLV